MSQIRRQTEGFSCENIVTINYIILRLLLVMSSSFFGVDKNYKANREIFAQQNHEVECK